MRPKVTFLEQSLIERVLDEAFQLLIKPGIKVSSEEARTLLADAGADVNFETDVVAIPEEIARQAMATLASTTAVMPFTLTPVPPGSISLIQKPEPIAPRSPPTW